MSSVRLTEDERLVVQSAADGDSREESMALMGITQVERSRILMGLYRKFGTHHLPRVVALAVKWGLVTPRECSHV